MASSGLLNEAIETLRLRSAGRPIFCFSSQEQVYCILGQKYLAGTDALEVLLLTLLLLALPPVLAGSVYFVFWHSLQHILRMNRRAGRAATTSWPALGGELVFFLRWAALLLAVRLTGLYGWP